MFASIGRDIGRGLVKGITASRDTATKATDGLAKAITAAGKKGIKREADRLIAARKKANDRIRKANKNRAKGAKAAELLPTLSRADAEKKAKRNLAAELAAGKAARRMLYAQERTIASLWAKGSGSGTSRLLGSITKSGNISKASGLNGQVTLADIAKAREVVAKSLEAAKGTLADLRKARADLASQVASSIKGELDLRTGIGQAAKSALGYDIQGKTTFASVAGTVKSMAAKAKTFANILGSLAKKGIPAGLIQEVAALGTTDGIEVGRALMSGTIAQIKSLANDYASLGSWSAGAGNYVAGAMFDVGIQAQAGIIKGLEADDAKLAKAAQNLATKITKAVKKALKIKSPSQVFRDEVGLMLTAGVLAGLDKGQPQIDARMSTLANPAFTAAGASTAGAPAASAPGLSEENVTINVTDVIGTREASQVFVTGFQRTARNDPGIIRAGLATAGAR